MNFLAGLGIIIGLVCLLFGALTRLQHQQRAILKGVASASRSARPGRGYPPLPSFGHWDAHPPRPQAHPYQDNLKKNQGGWRWG